jgi:hypothetical protein
MTNETIKLVRQLDQQRQALRQIETQLQIECHKRRQAETQISRLRGALARLMREKQKTGQPPVCP